MTDQPHQELRPRLGTTLLLPQAGVHLHAAELPHAVGPLDLPRVVELPDLPLPSLGGQLRLHESRLPALLRVYLHGRILPRTLVALLLCPRVALFAN